MFGLIGMIIVGGIIGWIAGLIMEIGRAHV